MYIVDKKENECWNLTKKYKALTGGILIAEPVRVSAFLHLINYVCIDKELFRKW